MRFFSYEEIKSTADCITIARDALSLPVDNDGRCAATWRGGTNKVSVHVTKTGFHDFRLETGGSVIDLVATVRFGGDVQMAQEFLGEYLHLTPKSETRKTPEKSKFEKLIEDGYVEVSRYSFNDISGNMVHFESRLEHPEKGKTFLQGTPRGWGLGLTPPILYNLQGVASAPWCCIVEGPKDANRLISMGIQATTCAGGAKKWHSDYAETFRDKSIAILPDNDEPGMDHARMIAASIIDVAAQVRIVMTSDQPKGDVSNYLDDGGTQDMLMALISNAVPLSFSDLDGIDIPRQDTREVIDAKSANEIPFRNFIPIEVEQDETTGRRRKSNGPEVMKQARSINDLTKDMHRRFLHFPRKVGEQLFDHDRDSGEIYYMHKASDMFAWIGRKGKFPVEWTRGDAMCDKADFFSSATAEAIRYESINNVPDWPKRSDVYYIHPTLPRPSPTGSYLNRLVDSFTVASECDRRVLKAFFCAPLWFVPRIPRPSWIIDSEDGQGCGKSTIAEACSFLYGAEPVRTCNAELQYGTQEITKRLLCSKGRNARMLLVDNVVGTFKSPVLADLITGWTVSGKRPYGPGEEVRPNNLTYVITSNDATVDTDIASRSFYIFVKRPVYNADWEKNLLAYIEKNRYHIISDIINMLDSHVSFPGVPASTRFAEFEQLIMQAVCKTPDAFKETIYHLEEKRQELNVEQEQAKSIEEMFTSKLVDLGINPHEESVWIRSQIVNSWGRAALADGYDSKAQPIQLVRALAKQRLLRVVDPKVKRWPHNGSNKTSGILWNYESGAVMYDKDMAVTYEIIRNSNGDAEKRMALL